MQNYINWRPKIYEEAGQLLNQSRVREKVVKQSLIIDGEVWVEVYGEHGVTEVLKLLEDKGVTEMVGPPMNLDLVVALSSDGTAHASFAIRGTSERYNIHDNWEFAFANLAEMAL